MISRRAYIVLVAAAAVLLVVFAVTAGVALLLGQMGDTDLAAVLRYFAIACLLFLAVDLICLVLTLGLGASAGRYSRAESGDDERRFPPDESAS